MLLSVKSKSPIEAGTGILKILLFVIIIAFIFLSQTKLYGACSTVESVSVTESCYTAGETLDVTITIKNNQSYTADHLGETGGIVEDIGTNTSNADYRSIRQW
ncbi:MAG: hypothetical protein ACLFP1_02445 [Candidatus Goldiibacteriota bacterium]